MTIAIIDATADAAGQTAGVSGSPRYVTPIANLPLIVHVFDELAGGGIEEARIIAGAGTRPELERVIGAGDSWGLKVSYLDAPEEDGSEVVLAEIDHALSAGSVLVHPGDCLFPHQVALMCERYRAGDVDLVLLGQETGPRGRDPHRDPREGRRVCDTALVLGPATRPVVDRLLDPPARGQRGLLESLLENDFRLAVCDLTQHWVYSDSNEALLTANRMMLDTLPVPAVDGDFGEGNRVHGRVAISPEARVSNCTLHGPIVIDDRAVVEESFIGPYTAIGADAIVSGAEIDNTMVLHRAEIRYPGLRIEASIIGERASVSRGFDLPKGLHLRLGPDSRVTLS